MPERMKFGVFLGPFHHYGENPTLSLDRDMELIEWLDKLDFDEFWIGEHHSGGAEIISDPTIFIAAAACRTRTIKLGTGVISLPYHHPLLVADRMVQLDHMTRGRVLFGVGPGALSSDAYMMGIDPLKQRAYMDESLGVIIRLLRGEVVDHESEWFVLRGARLQLLPYTRPCFPIGVACVFSPAGPTVVGKYGVGMLTVSSTVFGGLGAYAESWKIAEESAARNGQTVSRDDWRLVMPIHIADSKAEAVRDVKDRFREFTDSYFGGTLGRLGDPSQGDIESLMERGLAIVGSPDDVIQTIKNMQQASGGFGGLLNIGFEWASREKIMHSYELWGRYVAPQFQGSLRGPEASRTWLQENATTVFKPAPDAKRKAFEDAGFEITDEIMRGLGRSEPTRASS